MMNEPVHSIMTHDPITVRPEDSLDTVKKILLENRIHHIPVVENNEIIGLITTYDLWKRDENFKNYTSIKVRDIMNTRLAKISPEDKVGTAAEIFLDNRFHALPVVKSGKLVGIVTTFDVMRYQFKKEYPRPILFKHVFKKEHKAVV